MIGCIGTGSLYENAISSKIEVKLFTAKSFICPEALNYISMKNFDIINFHGAKAFFLKSFLSKKLDIPCVATVHSNYRQDFLNSKLKHLLYTPLSIKGLKSFDYFVCVSEYIKNILNKDGFAGRKFVVFNGLNLKECSVINDKNSVRDSLGIKKDDFVYIMVARFHPVKNHSTLIKAFSKLNKEFKNTKLLLIGDGENTLELKKLTNEDVIFAGFRENVLDYINASDISVLSSFSEGGAPPLVILESAAAKKTAAVSNVCDMPNIINKENGFTFDPNSKEDIYLKLKEAYLNKNKLDNMGEALYDYVNEKFSMDKFCSNYLSTYNSIIQDFNGVK